MKILMTGSTGFIGRHLLPLFDRSGDDVYHIVRQDKGFENEFVWNFQDPLDSVVPACDVAVHLAAYVHFSEAFKPQQYLINAVSTTRIAKYCLENKARMIFASMSGIHGFNGFITPASPIAFPNHYAMSKYLGESVVETFLRDAYILRLGGVYGLDGPTHLGLNKAITAAVRHHSVPVLKGQGKGKRNYICVEDAARWIFELAKEPNKDENKRTCRTLYIAGDETLTIEQYLQTLVDVFFPGGQLLREDGIDACDYVIQPSETSFPLLTFEAYLSMLKAEVSSEENG